MKITFITTIKHNIGDDFVRDGIISIISNINSKFTYELIHKHSPLTSYYGFESIRNLRLSNAIEPILRKLNFDNRISSADLVVQSGAPIFWCHKHGPHCYDNEWFIPLIEKTLLKQKNKIKFINIAGGSCQTYHSDGNEVNECIFCQNYIKKLYDVSSITTLRDELAKKILKNCSRSAKVLTCTSIFARDLHNINPFKGNYIVVNFMEGGGHYNFNQNINNLKWKNNFIKIVGKLSKIGNVIAACHDENEKKLIKTIIPNIDIFIEPNNYSETMKFYAGSRFAVVNRVHAGFMIASFGKPVVVIGNDSRSLMLSRLKLPNYYVNDINDEIIENIINFLLENENKYSNIIEEIRKIEKINYMNILENAL